MDIPRISVLVPVYKVEAYLQRCIDSVLAQDFQAWEMILVDDGSPDRCPQICDEAARKDPRISVIHKENGGLPSARLAGFERARGEYLVFLDSDDWLLEGALTTLYGAITTDGGYDIVKACNLRSYESKSSVVERSQYKNNIIVGNHLYLETYLNGLITPYLWGGIYKKSLFTEQMFSSILSFSEGEDWLINIAIWRNVNRLRLIDDVVCAYYINESSIMQSKVCSIDYSDRQHDTAYRLAAETSPKIKECFRDCRMFLYVQQFFIPELHFSWRNYNLLIDYLKENKTNEDKLYTKCPHKYLYFIRSKWLYWGYSRLYCMMVFLIKQKCKRKKIIL